MKNASIWIRNKPETGSERPWEVCFQVDSFPMQIVSSSASEKSAQKSMSKAIKRMDGLYSIVQK